MTTLTIRDKAAIRDAILAREAAIAQELKAAFEGAGYTVIMRQPSVLEVNNRRIVIDEQETGSDWNRRGKGKFYAWLDDADFHKKRFLERQGQINYAEVVAFFGQVMAALGRAKEADAKRRELNRQVDAIGTENDLHPAIRLVAEPRLAVRIDCADVDQMRQIALLVSEILNKGQK